MRNDSRALFCDGQAIAGVMNSVVNPYFKKNVSETVTGVLKDLESSHLRNDLCCKCFP